MCLQFRLHPWEESEMIQILPKKPSKQSPRLDGRTTRGESLTPTDLRKWADDLKNAAATFDGLAAAMETQKIEDVVADGKTMAERGLEQIKNFYGHIARGLMRDSDFAVELLLGKR
jgi:hypothetical protein